MITYRECTAKEPVVGVRLCAEPIAIATVVRLLVQFALLPIPKNDAQVACAGGEDPKLPPRQSGGGRNTERECAHVPCSGDNLPTHR